MKENTPNAGKNDANTGQEKQGAATPATPQPHIETNSWVDEVTNTPEFDGAVLLSGYLGKAAEDDSVVLYTDAGLNNKVSIKKADIIHVKKEGGSQGKPESSLVWVKKNGEYGYKAGNTDAKAKFLEGDIYSNYLSGANASPAPFVSLPGCVQHTTVCPPPISLPGCVQHTTVCPPHISLPGCVQYTTACPHISLPGCVHPTTTIAGTEVAARQALPGTAATVCTQPASGCHITTLLPGCAPSYPLLGCTAWLHCPQQGTSNTANGCIQPTTHTQIGVGCHYTTYLPGCAPSHPLLGCTAWLHCGQQGAENVAAAQPQVVGPTGYQHCTIIGPTAYLGCVHNTVQTLATVCTQVGTGCHTTTLLPHCAPSLPLLGCTTYLNCGHQGAEKVAAAQPVLGPTGYLGCTQVSGGCHTTTLLPGCAPSYPLLGCTAYLGCGQQSNAAAQPQVLGPTGYQHCTIVGPTGYQGCGQQDAVTTAATVCTQVGAGCHTTTLLPGCAPSYPLLGCTAYLGCGQQSNAAAQPQVLGPTGYQHCTIVGPTGYQGCGQQDAVTTAATVCTQVGAGCHTTTLLPGCAPSYPLIGCTAYLGCGQQGNAAAQPQVLGPTGYQGCTIVGPTGYQGCGQQNVVTTAATVCTQVGAGCHTTTLLPGCAPSHPLIGCTAYLGCGQQTIATVCTQVGAGCITTAAQQQTAPSVICATSIGCNITLPPLCPISVR